jgi:hypothetical protein
MRASNPQHHDSCNVIEPGDDDMTYRVPRILVYVAFFLLGVHGASRAVASAPKAEPLPSAAVTVGDLPSFVPNSQLDFVVPRTQARPHIDGKLDEALWRSAKKLTNFAEISPGDNTAPPVQTDVLLTYDSDNLYVGFICYEDDVSQIRAHVTDRDNISQDDFAGILLDTFHDRQTSYEFFVNPYGIQFDQRRTNGNEDNSFDTVWESAGEINSAGWTAEMAIPFRSLRFPNSDEQQWGIHALRIRPRDSREQHSWAPLSRDESCLFCQAGTMNGIHGVNSGRNLEFLPYAISSETGQLNDTNDPTSGFTNDAAKIDGGLGLKYGLTPNVTLDAAINPDFSQVESDAAQLSLNTTFALGLEEKRPFFLEGGDIFRSNINAVYTRSINDPVAAGKITGKQGKYTLGYIAARDDNTAFIVPFVESSSLAFPGRSVSNILRVKRDLWADSFAGMMFTDRRYADGSNTDLGIDWYLRFKKDYTLRTELMESYTAEPNDPTISADFNGMTFGPGSDRSKYTSDFDGEDYFGHAIRSYFERSARHWNSQVYYEDASPTFRADNGNVGANNYRTGGMWNGVTFRPDNRVFDSIEPSLNAGRKWDYAHRFKDEWLEPRMYASFKKQTYIYVTYLWSSERFHEVYIPGIRRTYLEGGTDFSRYFSGSGWIREGHSIFRSDAPFLAKERTASVGTTLRATSQLTLDTNYLLSKFTELDPQHPVPHDSHKFYSLRNKLTYQASKRLFVRVVGQYVKPSDSGGTFEFDPLLSYKINPFTVFFAGSTHNFYDYQPDEGYRQTARTFFVKFQYLFRV